VAYQRADTGTGVVTRFDGSSQSYVVAATIDDTTDRIDLASDSSGRVYVAYRDANSVTRVGYLDANSVVVDTGLESHLRLQFANAGFDSVDEISNLEYDSRSNCIVV